MNTPLRAVAAGLLVVTLQGVAGAATKAYHVVGTVASRSDVLASYGVEPGASVDVNYTVELTTPVYAQSGPPDNQTSYAGAITFMVIQIGDWSVLNLVPPAGSIRQDFVSVANDSGTGVNVDLLHVTTPGQDNDHVLYGLSGPLVVTLQQSDLDGVASSDQGIDQDPNQYPNGVGVALGPGGFVTFVFGDTPGGGGGGGKNPLSSCRKSQLAAGAKLCQSELKCHATYAKNPAKDPGATKRDACLDKSGDAFEKAYDKAAATALKKGAVCPTIESAANQRALVTGNVEDVLAEVTAVTPEYDPLWSGWLGAAASTCGSALGAEAADAGKPNAVKLGAARQKASNKLTTAAGKAVDKAEGKGVVFDSPPSVPGFVETVNGAIDAIAAALGGS